MSSSCHSLFVHRLTSSAKLPVKGSSLAAGYDLSSDGEFVVPARGKALVTTGVAVAVPYGMYGRIAPRSGLALKNSIDVGAGVCDADYRGEIKVLLFNHGDSDFRVGVGDRIAQFILEKIAPDAQVVEVSSLPSTERGEMGFGSTGV